MCKYSGFLFYAYCCMNHPKNCTCLIILQRGSFWHDASFICQFLKLSAHEYMQIYVPQWGVGKSLLHLYLHDRCIMPWVLLCITIVPHLIKSELCSPLDSKRKFRRCGCAGRQNMIYTWANLDVHSHLGLHVHLGQVKHSLLTYFVDLWLKTPYLLWINNMSNMQSLSPCNSCPWSKYVPWPHQTCDVYVALHLDAMIKK